MMIEFQPVRVNTASPDEEGRLVFAAGRLVAVLVQLSDEHETTSAGQWYLEHGFGALDGPTHPTFPSLDVVEHWVETQLTATGDDQRTRKVG